ncbi:hypothetical protein NORO109296_22200 [Nocardiopsis rhodophaea]
MVSPGCQLIRMGRVLMNRPTIDSMPATSAVRPDTVLPNSTSDRPVSAPSSRPQAPCTTVLRVRPFSRARAVRSAVRRGGRAVVTMSGRGASSSGASTNRVGSSTPASAARQAWRAASWSRPASQAR